jgi:tRNA (guanine-N7-)-methyltransferase
VSVRKPKRLPPEELAPYTLEVPGPPVGRPPPESAHPPEPLDWRAVFGNEGPVELEVGFGKGLFLLTAAAAQPQVNFVGVEIVRKYQLFTATRLALRKLTNVRVACTDARWFLKERVPPGSLQTVHLYFPDPWWKKRHHKRRVFTDEFVTDSERALRPGGRLSLATDVEEYYSMMRELVAGHPAFRELPPPEPSRAANDLDYLTNFERKYRLEGRPIYRAAYEKR